MSSVKVRKVGGVILCATVLGLGAVATGQPAKGTPTPAAKPTPAAAGKPAVAVAFPKDYRTWTHVKSMVIYNDKHELFGAFGGIHHVYANKKALAALKNKTDFPNGSTLVLDLLALGDSPGAYAEGQRKLIGVITRDMAKYKDTSGWGWQAFVGGDPNQPALKTAAEQKACDTCHQQVGAKHFVFSDYRP
jgi:hypothetical protein